MFKIAKDQSLEEIETVRSLFRDYQLELGFDLCFQGFEEELEKLPGVYSEPKGAILIAISENEIIGVVALKQLEPTVCEMKRLYVKPAYRKEKIGRNLVQEVIKIAKLLKYEIMKLDTLERLKPAINLYLQFGFEETEPYNYNPDETVKYYQKSLIDG